MSILLLLCSYSSAFVYDVYNNEMFQKRDKRKSGVCGGEKMRNRNKISINGFMSCANILSITRLQ